AGIVGVVAIQPEIGGSELHSKIDGQEGIGDQPHREITDLLYAGFAIVLVDEVCGDKYYRPQHSTRGQVETHVETQYVKAYRLESHGGFCREDLNAYHFRQQGIGNEYSGKDYKESAFLLLNGGVHGRGLLLDEVGFTLGSKRRIGKYVLCFP